MRLPQSIEAELLSQAPSQLAAYELFEQYSQRARLLKKHFNMTATRLMRLIYDTFPEIVALRPDEAILT